MKITNIFKKEKTMLEKEIEAVLLDMKDMYVGSEEYEVALNHLSTLHEINSKEKKEKKWNVSPDTMAVVAGNLLGIILILKHEELNVITSKAMNFVIKGRA